MTYPLPANPWQVVFSDCFEHANQHHCIFVDSYSDYIEVVELEDLTAATFGAEIAERVSALDRLSLRYAAIITLPVSNPGLCP